MDEESIAALKCVQIVRYAPGTVREIELVRTANGYALTSGIRKWVNGVFGFEALLQDPEGSSNEGESLDVVVTNSRYRLILDLLVSALAPEGCDQDVDQTFHISTFAEGIDYALAVDDRFVDITFSFDVEALAGRTPLVQYARELFETRENSGTIRRRVVTQQDIVAAYEGGGFKWADGLHDSCVVDVDIPYLAARFGASPIVDLDATSAVFVGKCDFTGAVFEGSTRFSGAVFHSPKVSFSRATFDVGGGDLSFRNARLFTDELAFDAAAFTATYPGHSVSFEDAKISGYSPDTQAGERLVKVSFNRIRAMGLAMVLFQLVAPNAEVSFIDSQVNEHVDFNDAQVRRLLFIAIASLASLDLKLRPPSDGKQFADLVLENCVVRSLLQIDNVATLSLRGTIIDGHLVTRWLVTDKSGHQSPNHGLLDAISVNNDTVEERSQQFLALKQNFADLGQYDLEDEAFARFMITKRRDSTTNAIMEAIRMISNYGISPGQVLKSVGITVLVFALIYGVTDVAFPGWYGFADRASPWWDCVVLSLSSFMGLGAPVSLASGVPVFLTLLEGILGWFFLGIFSVAIVRRTLR